MQREITSPLRKDRLSTLRHDLRNPLGEIVGFAEMLIEDARDQQAPELLRGLENIRQAAHRILADVNHALNPDTLRLTPRILETLKESIQNFAGQILKQSQDLSDLCDELGQTSIGDDLLRISGSARHLRDMAPSGLDALIAESGDPDLLTQLTERTPPITELNLDAQEPRLAATILVVDDQEANRALLARRLRKQGYTVSLAENGRHALERLRARKFDLVLLDILMPEIDGMEVLRQIKADPALAHIPVLMLSAVDELNAVVQCIELGAADYLPKPFPPAILQARVQASLANKRMADQLRKYTGWLFGKTLFSDAVASPASLTALSRQERTVLFADIRGFTSWSERHPPEEAVAMLNRYFERAECLWAASPVIKSEYTGDEIMGVFSDPLEAVRIAHSFCEELGRQLSELGLGIGVGLHTGLVIEGLMGGTEVKAYRFVGDTVNTARRICSEAKAGQVLLSAPTFRAVESFITAGAPFGLSVKGKTEPLELRLLQSPTPTVAA
jgi:adenylate cyclase